MKNLSLVFAAAALAYAPVNAWAYLDPGTGSMLLSVVVGLVSSAYFVARRLPSAARSLWYRMTGRKDVLQKNGIVFYAESASYWSTFEPVVASLVKRGVPVTYLTSDEKDPVFSAGFGDLVKARFIGKSNTAYTALGFLEADLFVLTTPGIDVLQIRRSPGVKKYIHIVHAAGDIHTYKLFSFDYYDAVFCSGPGQAKSLRALEALRNTKAKDLPVVGCPYFDLLAARAALEPRTADPKTILVAPTWGKNGLLTRTGSLVPKLLAEAGFTVILRPHPQSFISDKDVIAKVQQELAGFANITWDKNRDGFESLAKASLMVSDVSGVILDFAFVFLRPVITVGAGPMKDGFEAWEIPHEAWETEALTVLGRRVAAGKEGEIPAMVHELLSNANLQREKILALRSQELVNFGHAGEAAAEALLTELAAVRGEAHRA